MNFQVICKKAAGEVIVRQALAEINQWEVQSHFTMIDHLDFKKRNIALIKDFKEILNKVSFAKFTTTEHHRKLFNDDNFERTMTNLGLAAGIAFKFGRKLF